MATSSGRPLAQSARSVLDRPHGFSWFSRERYMLPSSVGKLDSMSDRYRRMSRILSRISMLTGQISSHALHEVHAQISSGVIRAKTELAVIVSAASDPMTGETGPPGWVAAMTLPTLV